MTNSASNSRMRILQMGTAYFDLVYRLWACFSGKYVSLKLELCRSFSPHPLETHFNLVACTLREHNLYDNPTARSIPKLTLVLRALDAISKDSKCSQEEGLEEGVKRLMNALIQNSLNVMTCFGVVSKVREQSDTKQWWVTRASCRKNGNGCNCPEHTLKHLFYLGKVSIVDRVRCVLSHSPNSCAGCSLPAAVQQASDPDKHPSLCE